MSEKVDVATCFVQPRVSDSDLISEENQNRLLMWRDVFRTGQFDIGDCAVEIIEEKARNGANVTNERIFSAMYRYCGKKPRTIRLYYEVALFFPREVREGFDTLPFSHFVFAKSMGVASHDVLEYSAQHTGITLERVEEHFLGRENEIGNFDYRQSDDGETVPQHYFPQSLSCETSQDYDLETHLTLDELNGIMRELRSLSQKCAKLRTIPEIPADKIQRVSDLFHEINERIAKLAEYLV